jgi:hypothetical protein
VARLAQTSIRFRRYEIGSKRFGALSTEIDAVAASVAREIYGPSVEVDIVVEAGSLLVRVTVIGLLLGTYDAISKYPDFKEGLVALVEDAEKYGSVMVDEIMKLTGAEKPDSVNKRSMTPGKLFRVIEKLEHVKGLEKKAPTAVIQEELRGIARDVLAIERDLQPEEVKQIDDVLGSKGLPPLEDLPKPMDFEQRSAILREKFGRPSTVRERRQKLRHHNRFVVGQRKK